MMLVFNQPYRVGFFADLGMGAAWDYGHILLIGTPLIDLKVPK